MMEKKSSKEIGWLLQEKHGGKLTASAKKDIKRIEAGEPLDHIIGFVEFLGCKILVDKNVLIPRFETEFWVEQGISQISYEYTSLHKRKIMVLDMFAGSGCIGIAVLKRAKNFTVVFADSQKEALKQIKKNCSVNKIPESRYEIIESDVFSNVKGPSQPVRLKANGVRVNKFDYIFANPPYIPTTRKGKVQKSVLQHEPKPALFGGNDGLLYITRFLAEAKHFLNSGGKIYMEFDAIQRSKINILLKKFRYKNWQFHKDQYDRFRWVVIDN